MCCVTVATRHTHATAVKHICNGLDTDFVSAESAIKRRAVNLENSGSLGFITTGPLQGVNQFMLLGCIKLLLTEVSRWPRTRRTFFSRIKLRIKFEDFFGKMLQEQIITEAENNSSLNDMFQFSDIAGPGVYQQCIHGTIRNRMDLSCMFLGKKGEKVFD